MAKILLVEDDNNLREIYEARLQAEGYTIVSAHDGEEALVVAKAEKPDLIISDVMMPKISGFEMLDILRNTEGMKNVKIMMLTALGQSDDQQRADKLGADRYLVKSQVTLEDIARVANELLQPGKQPTSPDNAAATTDTTDAGSNPLADDSNPPSPTAPTPSEPATPPATPPAEPSASTDPEPSDDDSTPPTTPEPPTTPPVDPSPAEPPATPPTEPPTEPSAPPPASPTPSEPSAVASSPTPIQVTVDNSSEPEPSEPKEKAVSSDIELGSLTAAQLAPKPTVTEEPAESTETASPPNAPSEPLAAPVVGNTPGSQPITNPTDEAPVIHPDATPPVEDQPAGSQKAMPSYSPQPAGKKVIEPLPDSESPPDINELLRREDAQDIMTEGVSANVVSPMSPSNPTPVAAPSASQDIPLEPLKTPLSSEPPAQPNPVASAATDLASANVFDPNKIAL